MKDYTQIGQKLLESKPDDEQGLYLGRGLFISTWHCPPASTDQLTSQTLIGYGVLPETTLQAKV